MNNKTKGVVFIALATMIYGILPVLMRMTFDEGSNAATACFIRFTLCLPVLLVILVIKRVPLGINKKEMFLLFLTGGIGTAGTTLLFNHSFSYIAVGMAATLHFIYPILVPLACVVLFKDKMDKWKLMALVAGVAGVIAFMEPGHAAALGIIMALASGVTYAGYIILVDKTTLNDMDNFKLTFYLCAFAALVSLICALAEGNLTVTEVTPKGWLISVFFSLTSTVGSLTLFQQGMKYVGPSTAAIMSTIEPITSVVLGILLLGEDITFLKILGCSLIVLSIILISRSVKGPSAPEPIPVAEV